MKKLIATTVLLTLTACQNQHGLDFMASEPQSKASEAAAQASASSSALPTTARSNPANTKTDAPDPKAAPLGRLGTFQILALTEQYLILAQDAQALVLGLKEGMPSSGLLELKQLNVKGQALASSQITGPDGQNYDLALFGAEEQLVFRVAAHENVWFFGLATEGENLYRVSLISGQAELETFAAVYDGYLQRAREAEEKMNQAFAEAFK